MNGPHLIHLSDADFDSLPNRVVPRTIRLSDPAFETPKAVQWIFIGYCEKFLSKNDGLKPVFEKFAGHFDDPECLRHFTRGQRVLNSVADFDGQVTNGGITQFFWNCPDLIFEVSESLTILEEKELTEDYDRALKRLIENKENWMELRKQSRDQESDFWKFFEQSYDLLDLNWFDQAYFRTYGPALVARTVDYVKSHKREFITT